jgi:uncharacterized membrane protein
MGACGDGSSPSPLRSKAMITSQGYALIAELIATLLLTAALTGFTIQRSQTWLVAVAIAFMILTVAITIVVDSST